MVSQIRVIALQIRQSSSRFPSIFRFITERFFAAPLTSTKITLVSLLSLLLLGAITNQSLILRNNLKDLDKITQAREDIQKQISNWKSMSEDHKNHAAAYLKIASLEYRLGNVKEARIFIEKALAIDPYTQQGRMLGEYISR